MKQWMPVLLFVLMLATGARAAEAVVVPNAAELTQALERGSKLRVQRGVVLEALMRVGVILKAGDVRCGYTLVKIDDARGEAGATYRLTEQMKGCVPRGADMEVIEYTGVLLLDADLALRGGSQLTTKTVTSAKSSETERVSAEISVRNGELSWIRKEKRADDPEFVEKSDPVKLYGVHPIPHNALICLAAFAAKEPGFKAGVSSPFCVPSLDTGGTIDSFLIQPSWLETDVPKNKAINPAEKLVVRMKILEGALNEKGMTVEPPGPEGWGDSLDWTFDENFKIVGMPGNPDTYITSELVDADKLDANAPMDFAKVREAMKVLEEKARKEISPTSKR